MAGFQYFIVLTEAVRENDRLAPGKYACSPAYLLAVVEESLEHHCERRELLEAWFPKT